MRKMIVGGMLLAAVLAVMQPASAEDFPTKPVRIVVPYSAGGGTDIVARMIAEKLSDKLGQRVLVENHTGAGGNLGAAKVYESPPDGYTLFFTAQGPLAVNKYIFKKLAYEPEKFEPVSLVVLAYSVLLANPKVEVEDIKALIAYAKANPGKIDYASQGVGTAAHLTAELFKSMAGVNLQHVPYKGSAPAVTDLLAGHVDVMFGELAFAKPYIESGKLRPLAVTSEARNPSMPNVPAVAEVLPGFSTTSWWAIVAPPGTPKALTEKLSKAIAASLNEQDVKKKITDLGMVVKGSTPAELAAFAKKESDLWGNVTKDAGIGQK